jgi:hypothetical protein
MQEEGATTMLTQASNLIRSNDLQLRNSVNLGLADFPATRNQNLRYQFLRAMQLLLAKLQKVERTYPKIKQTFTLNLT